MRVLGMRRSFIIFSYFVGLAIGLVPFTNCDNYTSSEAFNEINEAASVGDTTSLNCTTGKCVQPTSSDQLRLSSVYNRIYIKAGVTEAVIGGTCSVGNFFNNRTRWKILNAAQQVYQDYSSDQRCAAGQTCGHSRYRTCIEENYQVRIQIPPAVGTYEAIVEIEGISELGAITRNTVPSINKVIIIVQP